MFVKNLWILFVSTYFLTSLIYLDKDLKNVGKIYTFTVLKLTFLQLFINIFFIYPLVMLIFENYNIYRTEFYFPLFPLEIIINYYFFDIILYYIHKLLHKRFFYNFIHKKRHLFYNTTAFSTYFSNPIDFVLIDILPIFFGLILLNAHYYTYYFFVFTETYLACKNSAGFGKNSTFKKYHMKKQNKYFGINMLMDNI